MARGSGGLLLLGLSGSAVLLGFVLSFPLFSSLPIYWGIGLAGVFALGFAACSACRRRAVPSLYAGAGLVYSMLYVGAIVGFTGVERLEAIDCDWRLRSGHVEVDLRDVGGFGWSPIASEQLSEHLRLKAPPRVRVLVPIIRDFGRVRARGAIESVNGIPVQELGMVDPLEIDGAGEAVVE